MKKKNPTRQLEIKDLCVSTADGEQILHGINLTIRQWEIHTIIGNDKSSKNALLHSLSGHSSYSITQGSIVLNGVDITHMTAQEKAVEGLFLGYPFSLDIPLFSRLNPVAKLMARNKKIIEKMTIEGFIGSETERIKVIELALLKPCFAILDEPTSRLGMDALQYICATIQTMTHNFGLLLLTHSQRILQYIEPDVVHVLLNGKIVKSGDYGLVKEVKKYGYNHYIIN